MYGTGRREKRKRSANSNSLFSVYEALLRKRFKLAKDARAADPEVIEVTKVDLHILKNTVKHHTDEFEITDRLVGDGGELLVIRRGQTFNMKIEFNRKYNKEKDDLRLVFQFGISPLPNQGTHAEFVLSDRDETDEWGAYIQSQDSNSISLVVMTPPTCPVGKWRMNIDVVKRADKKTSVFRHTHSDPIYILFNPWCENDDVYLHEKGTKLLGEYVLNDTGKLYSGSSGNITYKPWTFGQFTGNVLDCILYLLDESSLADRARGDPVLVSRKLSALINSSDEQGVLTGNWSGNYAGGTSPLRWTGSVDILEQYYKTKSPVRFGQCWVFSGVLTTACRALGIPARSVTNFSSAHDTDSSITIDTYLDKDGKPMEGMSCDSVWNFHVWNDVWMARKDLPAGYGGWQAIDATPQEASDGVYCMGPMSLEAIKNGDVNQPYDGKFVFAEVNADRVYWALNAEGQYEVVDIHMAAVGKNVSTKVPGGDDREDVTGAYKFPFGWKEERAAVTRANRNAVNKSNKHAEVYERLPKDVTFELIIEPDKFIGDTIVVELKVTNTSAEKRTIHGSLSVHSMYITGVLHKQADTLLIDDFVLQSNEEKLIPLEVTPLKYLDKLTDDCLCSVFSMCYVDQTKQTAQRRETLRLRKPKLNVKAPKKGKVGEKIKVDVSFKNPLDEFLTDGELRVEGPYLQKAIRYKQGHVAKMDTFTYTFEITPSKPGKRTMVVYFNCDQIDAVNTSYEITIEKK